MRSRRYIEQCRWPSSEPICVHCGASGRCSASGLEYRCLACAGHFSWRANTIFAGRRLAAWRLITIAWVELRLPGAPDLAIVRAGGASAQATRSVRNLLRIGLEYLHLADIEMPPIATSRWSLYPRCWPQAWLHGCEPVISAILNIPRSAIWPDESGWSIIGEP